jgi:hypothetical protein
MKDICFYLEEVNVDATKIIYSLWKHPQIIAQYVASYLSVRLLSKETDKSNFNMHT